MSEEKPKSKAWGGKRAHAKLHDGLRAAQITIERMAGKSITEIARKYDLPVGQIRKMLTAADEAGFIDHYRAAGYEQLMSKAWAVYEARLDIGDLDAARDIAFGLGVLQKDGRAARLKEKAAQTLDEYRALKQGPVPAIDKLLPKEEMN